MSFCAQGILTFAIEVTYPVLFPEARAKIQETGTDKMVKKGSSIELNCTVESGDHVHASMAVFWYLDDRVLDWMGQTGPGKGARVVETRGKVCILVDS